MVEHVAIQNLREYLRIRTVHPDPDYDGAKNWLLSKGKELGLKAKLIEVKYSLIFPKFYLVRTRKAYNNLHYARARSHVIKCDVEFAH